MMTSLVPEHSKVYAMLHQFFNDIINRNFNVLLKQMINSKSFNFVFYMLFQRVYCDGHLYRRYCGGLYIRTGAAGKHNPRDIVTQFQRRGAWKHGRVNSHCRCQRSGKSTVIVKEWSRTSTFPRKKMALEKPSLYIEVSPAHNVHSLSRPKSTNSTPPHPLMVTDYKEI